MDILTHFDIFSCQKMEGSFANSRIRSFAAFFPVILPGKK
jgi:hypothetical protein